MDTLLFEYHTAHTRFSKLLAELSKYKTKLKASENPQHFDNIVENCKANLKQMQEANTKMENEFTEFKLRTLKEIESLSSPQPQLNPTKWMESPFDVYAKQ